MTPPIMSKRRLYFGYLGTLPMLLIMLWFGYDELSRRPGVDTGTLRVDPLGQPYTFSDAPGWINTGQAVIGFNESWQPNSIADEGWRQEGGQGLVFGEAIFDYWTPLGATWYFPQARLSQPATKVDLPYHSPFAAQQKAVCGAGTAEQCGEWHAWLRYGQYITQIALRNQAAPISIAEFSRYVEQTDRATERMFQSVTKEYPSAYQPLGLFYGIAIPIIAVISLFLTRSRRVLIWMASLRSWQVPNEERQLTIVKDMNVFLLLAQLVIGLCALVPIGLARVPNLGNVKWLIFVTLFAAAGGFIVWSARRAVRLFYGEV